MMDVVVHVRCAHWYRLAIVVIVVVVTIIVVIVAVMTAISPS